MKIAKVRKRTLGKAKTYYFISDEKWDTASPLRAMAQFIKRHPEFVVLALGVNYGDEGYVGVTLTVE